jgi:hypothetical protein
MGRSVHRVYHKSCDQSPSTRRDEEPLTAVRTNSESFTRTFRRQKRKDHPSASPEPPVRAPKTKERSHSVRQTRSRDQTSSKDFTVRRGIDYGDIDSGEECINVAVPQDALSLIKAERGGKKRVTNLSTTISSIMSTIYPAGILQPSFPQVLIHFHNIYRLHHSHSHTELYVSSSHHSCYRDLQHVIMCLPVFKGGCVLFEIATAWTLLVVTIPRSSVSMSVSICYYIRMQFSDISNSKHFSPARLIIHSTSQAEDKILLLCLPHQL